MPVNVDYIQIVESTITGTDSDGSEFQAQNATVVPVVVTDVSSMLSGYTPGAAVDSTTAQSIARAVLDALAVYTS